MEFVNQTPYPATMFRTALFYKDLIMSTVVVKCSFEVMDGVARAVDDPLDIVEADLETAYGPIDGDLAPVKEGCDFAVMGDAMVPDGEGEVPKMAVTISVADLQHRLRVTGDRHWMRKRGDFEPSSPVPFRTMPMQYQRSFGGPTIFHHPDTGEALTVKSPLNPEGKGYIELKEYAEGTPLPNVEAFDTPIQTWRDRPQPAGCAPLPRNLPLRGLRGVTADLEAETTCISPAWFLFGHPDMHLDAYPHGRTLSVTGMSPNGRWSVRLPELRFAVTVALGDAQHVLPLETDTLVAIPAYNRFFVAARRAFVYQYVPKRVRTVTLQTSGPQPASIFKTIASERNTAHPTIPIALDDTELMPLPMDMFLEHYPLTRIIEGLPLLASG